MINFVNDRSRCGFTGRPFWRDRLLNFGRFWGAYEILVGSAIFFVSHCNTAATMAATLVAVNPPVVAGFWPPLAGEVNVPQ